ELVESRKRIAKIIQTEEERFASTLARGMDFLAEEFARMEKSGDSALTGETLFKLHDTYGFPRDIALDMAEERGYTADLAGFDAAMARQRAQARSAWTGSGQEAIAPIYRQLHEELGETQFLGYDTTESIAAIAAIVKAGERADSLSE